MFSNIASLKWFLWKDKFLLLIDWHNVTNGSIYPLCLRRETIASITIRTTFSWKSWREIDFSSKLHQKIIVIKTHFWNNDFTKSETWQTARRKKWLKITWLLLYNQPLTLVPRDTKVYLKGQVHEFKMQVKFFPSGFLSETLAIHRTAG